MRTNVDLDGTVHSRLRLLFPESARNAFISEANAEKLETVESRALAESMRDIATRAEREELQRDWEGV